MSPERSSRLESTAESASIGGQLEIVGARVGDVKVTDSNEGGGMQSVAWTGSTYLVAGVETVSGVDERFVRGICT